MLKSERDSLDDDVIPIAVATVFAQEFRADLDGGPAQGRDLGLELCDFPRRGAVVQNHGRFPGPELPDLLLELFESFVSGSIT